MLRRNVAELLLPTHYADHGLVHGNGALPLELDGLVTQIPQQQIALAQLLQTSAAEIVWQVFGNFQLAALLDNDPLQLLPNLSP